MDNGYLQFGEWRGIPIRLHWSMPLGALFFGNFKYVPAVWLSLYLLILVHECGHALAVKRCGAEVLAIDLTAWGGRCCWEGRTTPIQRACIAWAGVWAQLLILGAAFLMLAVADTPTNTVTRQFAHVATRTNLLMIALNLLPVAPFDGAEAWPLFSLLWQRFQKARRMRKLERFRFWVIEFWRRNFWPGRGGKVNACWRHAKLSQRSHGREGQAKNDQTKP